MQTKTIHIVCAKDDGPDLRFVEVETPDGQSVAVGRWILVGECPGLADALEQIERGHATFRLGDASSVLTSLERFEAGPDPRESDELAADLEIIDAGEQVDG